MSDDVMADAEQGLDPDDLDAEVVEDLDVDEDADGVGGGTSMHTAACPTF